MTWGRLTAFGWQRDLPDHRDYGVAHPEARRMLGRLPEPDRPPGDRPAAVDLRGENWPPVRDQRPLQSSPAHACIGLVEYFERRARGVVDDLSHQFLYSAARQLGRQTGDTGVGIRVTLKAICRFGVPSASYYLPDGARHGEPGPFQYSVAKKFPNLIYVRLDLAEDQPDDPSPCDGGRLSGDLLLARVKGLLAAGFPCVFGFPVTSLVGADSAVPFPGQGQPVLGGQAVIAAGYDDHRRVDGSPHSGVLLVRNSWGARWGDEGYGWLPYRYVTSFLAADFWTLLDPAWLESGSFSRPRI